MIVIALLTLSLVFLGIHFSVKNEMKQEKAGKEGEYYRVQVDDKFRDKFGENFNSDYHTWRVRNDALYLGYNIAGINFRHLDDSYVGEFEGFVKLEENNEYDRFAIAIYKGRKKVGYIPRDSNQELHEELSDKGGKAPCKGYIYTFINEDGDERFAGEVVLGKDDTETESYSSRELEDSDPSAPSSSGKLIQNTMDNPSYWEISGLCISRR